LKGLIRVALVAGAATVLALPAATAQAATRCPATFQVLHNDQIGAMKLPAGAYNVAVTNLSCASASTLFAEFLADYDGDLPFPWRMNAARKSFTNGSSGFSVSLVRSAPAPPMPPSGGYTCGGTFTVLHNDRIGTVSLPAGQYTVTLLTGGINCAGASRQFAQFLDYPSGRLPAAWTFTGTSGSSITFTGSSSGISFRATKTSGSTGGGGRSAYQCGIYRVLHNDHVGSLYVPKGSYEVVLPVGSTMTCGAATTALTGFLDNESLPRPWIINSATGAFSRGAGSSTTFAIDPIAGSVG
jgi:hypothetical protein